MNLHGRAVALVALTVLSVLVLGGSTWASGRPVVRASPTAVAGARAPAVQDFRSVRTYEAAPAPVRLRIPAAHVDTRLDGLGRLADGTVEVPQNPAVAGWYRDGPHPGEPGPAVVLGHVDSDHGPAVFFHLAELTPGAMVYIDDASGRTITFQVTGLTRVPKSQFPTDLVFAPTLEPSLRLVTCGGSFDFTAHHYRDNVIVYAAPA